MLPEMVIQIISLLHNLQMTLLPWAGGNTECHCFGFVKMVMHRARPYIE